MGSVMVVDDKELMRDSVGTVLARRGHRVIAAPGGREALTRLAERGVDAVVTDLQMPGMDGLELLAEIRRIDESLPVVFMTAYGTVETAVRALKAGAFDYVTKPFTGDELALTVERAIEHVRLLRENQLLRVVHAPHGAPDAAGRLVGDSHCMLQLQEELKRLAESNGTVLIAGESGTGKEVAARFVHAHSPRRSAPFLAVNCAALSPALLESELFGHEKGSFTGADRLRKGRFELADGGTLLLDEVSEIPPELQAKLLRVLQERCFERVGSSHPIKVDVRVIATTNRDLRREVEAGNFRGDLYFRLDVLPVRMPALRERLDDVPQLAEHFLEAVARREGRPRRRLSPDAAELLRSYAWPGNVRELCNVCERAAVLASEEMIPARLLAPWIGLPPHLNGNSARNALVPQESAAVEVLPGGLPICDGTITLETLERDVILRTLERHRGHRERSARALGIGVRTLGLKLRRWKDEGRIAPTV
ncbi:MAG: sigma-54-dependent Fis family transcriptional regulator [Phycisphaeraceae bacterium]|nr:sigma-54-dependent Fis family transcriptional regulator [Phycisphaeraceae bacterium]